jgi:lipopolysaccharide biosynthesis protein
VDEQFRQVPLFIIVEETEVGERYVLITRWVIWYNGYAEILDSQYITGG